MPAVGPELGGVGQREWKTIDASLARFVSLSKDFFFVESCCKNAEYDPACVYIPVQNQDKTCHVFKLDVTDPGAEPQHVMQVKKLDGEVEISPFGSALSRTGVMWICAFNENKLIAVDLNEKAVVATATCPCPNDCDLSDDEKWVYAGCGSRLGKIRVAAGWGDVYRVTAKVGTAKNPSVRKAKLFMKDCQGTMAGIAERGNKIFCAHLQRMTEYTPRGHLRVPGTRAATSTHRGKMFWSGYGEEEDKYFLCDNLTWWDETKLLTPCYRTIPGTVGHILDQAPVVSCIGWCCARAATTIIRLKEDGIAEIARVNDDGFNAEVDLSFSLGDEFKDVHFSVHNMKSGVTSNYRMECDGEKFDGHVTHADRFAGHVVLINFQKNFVGIVPETAFEAPL